MSVHSTLDPDHQDVIDDPSIIQDWNNAALLIRFLDTRLIIMTETEFTSSKERIARAIKVGRIEHEEILRRMKEGHCEDSLDSTDRIERQN